MYDFQLLTISATLSCILSATYFPFIKSLSRCILFLPCVAFHLILPSIISCSNLSTCPNHTCLHFLTVSNIVLVSFALCRTFSLLILSMQLIFSILLQIHISMVFLISFCLLESLTMFPMHNVTTILSSYVSCGISRNKALDAAQCRSLRNSIWSLF